MATGSPSPQLDRFQFQPLAQSTVPQHDAVHVTLRGFATRSKRVAEQLKLFAEQLGWRPYFEFDGKWYSVHVHGPTGADVLLAAKEVGKSLGVQVWFWTSLVYDPRRPDGGAGSTTAEQVVASAEA